MNQIMHYDWLPEQARWRYLVLQEKFPESHYCIAYSLVKLAGCWPSQKKELGLCPAFWKEQACIFQTQSNKSPEVAGTVILHLRRFCCIACMREKTGERFKCSRKHMVHGGKVGVIKGG